MMILGIETSCDETASAVVRSGREVLSNVVYSQVALHGPYGGVVPEIACRSHVEALPGIVGEAVTKADLTWDELDAIAVTYGPGLASSLLVGIAMAKGLALRLDRPLYAVNHLHAHIYSAFLADNAPAIEEVCPFLALVVSGGHTCLVRVDSLGKHTLLGQTIDDAAGEAFDKGAKLLGLGYPGGPAIEATAAGGDPAAVSLPRGMWAKGGLDTSFSGLKTALYTHVRKAGLPEGEDLADLCASLQEAVVDVLVRKTQLAVEAQRAERVVVSGGVAANTRLRDKMQQLCARRGLQLCIAPREHCTDNGAMIALAGQLRLTADLVPAVRPLELGVEPGWELGSAS